MNKTVTQASAYLLAGMEYLASLCNKLRVATRYCDAELHDEALHGTYVGISPQIAALGGSFEDALLSFTVGKTGITQYHTGTLPNGKRWIFGVHFPASWIFHLRNWRVGHALAVRQSEASNLAQLVLMFTYQYGGGTREVDVLLGEGMPMLLGRFISMHGCVDPVPVLEKWYLQYYQPMEHREKTSDLIDLNLEETQSLLARGSEEEKVEVLGKLAHNLWTADEDTLASRLRLIEYVLQKVPASAAVWEKALETFILNGRVRGGVGILERFADRWLDLILYVPFVEQFVDACTCLLYEVWKYLCPYNRITSLFECDGPLTDDELLERLNGKIVSPQIESDINRIASRSLSRQWTMDDYHTLRTLLNKAMTSRFCSEKVRREIERALTEHEIT